MSSIYQHTSGAGAAELESYFWRSVRDARLQFQHCAECRYVRWPVAPSCPECLSDRYEWLDDAGLGTVWSHCRYEDPAYTNEVATVPYTLVAVELASGPFLHGVLAGETDVGIGASVQLRCAPALAFHLTAAPDA